MDKFINWIQENRDQEVSFQKKCKSEEDNNSDWFFYLEGRISAFSDVILQYYYHYKDKEDK